MEISLEYKAGYGRDSINKKEKSKAFIEPNSLFIICDLGTMFIVHLKAVSKLLKEMG